MSITVCWNRNGQLRKDGTGIVSVCITYGGERKYINTGFAVKEKSFDKKNQRIINDKDAQSYNIMIDDITYKYKKRFNELLQKGDIFDLADILNTENKAKTDFLEFIKAQAKLKLNQHGDTVTDSQQNAYKNLIENLSKFANRKKIPFEKITLDFIRKFDLFLQTEPINNGKPLHHNTRKKRHDILRSFVKLAYDEKYITANPYDKFKCKAMETRRDYLTDGELKLVENLKPLKSLELSRDLFLFGCYTGLRFQDIMDLTPKNISYENEKIFLNVREQKTQKNKINLPLHLLFNGKAVQIIEKYKTVYRQTIFPPITNTSVNRHLKSIAQSVGIEKELSFHCSRHTFGTYLANHNGDASLIKLLMNHSDYKTSYRYIHESETMQEKKLQNINWDY